MIDGLPERDETLRAARTRGVRGPLRIDEIDSRDRAGARERLAYRAPYGFRSQSSGAEEIAKPARDLLTGCAQAYYLYTLPAGRR